MKFVYSSILYSIKIKTLLHLISYHYSMLFYKHYKIIIKFDQLKLNLMSKSKARSKAHEYAHCFHVRISKASDFQ